MKNKWLFTLLKFAKFFKENLYANPQIRVLLAANKIRLLTLDYFHNDELIDIFNIVEYSNNILYLTA